MDERFEMPPHTNNMMTTSNQRKRKRTTTTPHEQAHILYSDELLDYFMLSSDTIGYVKPEPPPNFNPDWIIDNEGHTALHWAASMGDVEIMKDLRRYGANLGFQNARGETPLMRCVLFVNCQDKKTMPEVVNELIETVDLVDFCHATALHHAAGITISRQKHSCARYYLDIILNKIQEIFEPQFAAQIINAQDIDGNTALHIAAKNRARKCVRALIGRNAAINIRNNQGVTAEDEIRNLNEIRRIDRQNRGSSSPYGLGKDSQFDREIPEEPRRTLQYVSEAAMSIQSRIAPHLVDRIQALAVSFDDELRDKETSEHEARRILNATIAESEGLNQQVAQLTQSKKSKELSDHSQEELSLIQKKFASLVERQQVIQLQDLYQRALKEENTKNPKPEESNLDEKIWLAQALADQQNKRQMLIKSYLEARSMAGVGEKSELYRRVLVKSLGPDVSLVDENLDALVEQLKEDELCRQSE